MMYTATAVVLLALAVWLAYRRTRPGRPKRRRTMQDFSALQESKRLSGATTPAGSMVGWGADEVHRA